MDWLGSGSTGRRTHEYLLPTNSRRLRPPPFVERHLKEIPPRAVRTMKINWMLQDDFWAHVESRHSTVSNEPDVGFTFLLPFTTLRALIAETDPVDTPNDEEDFPGPVARWYGNIDGRCFTVTCHYSGAPPHTVIVMHENTEGTQGIVMEAIGAMLRSSAPPHEGRSQPIA